MQERSALGREGILPLAQRAVFFLELHHGGDEVVEALLEPAQFEFDLLRRMFGHTENYRSPLPAEQSANRGFRHNPAVNHLISYPGLQRLLAQAHAVSDAAEAHGTLAGALCAASPYTFEDWLAEILPDGRATEGVADALRTVFDATVDALQGQQMEFQPLVPDDDDHLADRVTALGEWCHGFLYGLGTGQLRDLDAAGGEVGEVLRDFTEITHVTLEGDEGNDSSEEDYAQLVEFVRVGVQLVYEQLEPLRDVPRPDGAALH